VGLGTDRTHPAGLGIEGIPRSVIDQVSRRSAQMSGWHGERNHRPEREGRAWGGKPRGEAARATYPDLLAAWGVRPDADEKVVSSKVRYEKSRQRGG